MKKICLLLICFFLQIGSIYAATITNSKYENDQLTLTGTGIKQVQIVIFDKDNNPVYMTTADASSGSYNITLPKIAGLEDGNYVIKAANYDGSNAVSKEMTISNEPSQTTQSTESTKTTSKSSTLKKNAVDEATEDLEINEQKAEETTATVDKGTISNPSKSNDKSMNKILLYAGLGLVCVVVLTAIAVYVRNRKNKD